MLDLKSTVLIVSDLIPTKLYQCFALHIPVSHTSLNVLTVGSILCDSGIIPFYTTSTVEGSQGEKLVVTLKKQLVSSSAVVINHLHHQRYYRVEF